LYDMFVFSWYVTWGMRERLVLEFQGRCRCPVCSLQVRLGEVGFC
jgi:hypothetical protein